MKQTRPWMARPGRPGDQYRWTYTATFETGEVRPDGRPETTTLSREYRGDSWKAATAAALADGTPPPE